MESDWSWISHDKIIKKKIIENGNLGIHPFIGSRCKVKFINVLLEESKVVENCPGSGCEREYIIGDSETLFDRLLNRLLLTMVCQEVCNCELVVGDTVCNITLELIECQLASKPFHRLTDEEKHSEGERLKGRASELIKLNRFEDAASVLKRSFQFICWSGGNKSNDSLSDLYFSVIANLSLCSLKLNQMERTVTLCTKVLNHQPKNVKCLLRRALALDSLEEAEKAKDDISTVLSVEPNNKMAEDMLSKIKNHISKQKMEYSALVKKMLQVNR